MLPPVKLFINKIKYSTFCMYLYEYHLFNLVNLQISSRLCFWFYSILWKNMQRCSVEYNINNSSWQFRQNGSFWTGQSLQTYCMDLSFALVQFSFLERLTGQYQVHLIFFVWATCSTTAIWTSVSSNFYQLKWSLVFCISVLTV